LVLRAALSDIPIIFAAEFARKVKSRPFIIGTLVGALAIIGLSALPSVMSRALSNATKRIVVAGDRTLVAPAVELLAAHYDIVARLPRPTRPPTLADLNGRRNAAAYIVIDRGSTGLAVTAYARDPANFDAGIVRDLVPLNVALATGLPMARATRYLNVDSQVKSLDAKFADPASADAARGIAYILVLLLYMAILLNSQTVMSSVAEEKTSRIAELLISATSPAQLLTGKILAAGVIGLIQLGVWIIAGVGTGAGIVASFGGRSAHAGRGVLESGAIDVSAGVILAFVLFFIIGFMQYATLYAAAASLINRTEDLGSVAAPLLVPVIGGFILAQYALAFPQSRNVAILSQIPLISPFVMFTRMTVTTVPAWQIGVSLALNGLATVAIIWGAGKVYRVGLLLYGRPPSIRQVIAALRA
jgi:ABC-2 type transport system permease protein